MQLHNCTHLATEQNAAEALVPPSVACSQGLKTTHGARQPSLPSVPWLPQPAVIVTAASLPMQD